MKFKKSLDKPPEIVYNIISGNVSVQSRQKTGVFGQTDET